MVDNLSVWDYYISIKILKIWNSSSRVVILEISVILIALSLIIILDGCDSFADDVTDNIVVWFDGRAEIGPRALGHRSLIGDPRSMAVKNRMNEVKQRQWWRPVAPMILDSECENWFVQSFPSLYMLNNFLIQPKKKNVVPAILQLDDTC